ncbi:MAG TPA: hypothetical protein PLK82_06985, partial [Bacteroidales bacterium]|nr:hypothetical protein [Bacteroidales bacterium]
MKNIDFKKLLPYLAAVAIFVVITMVYFSPLLEGKKMVQSDIIHFKGMSKEIIDYRAKTGQEALWTNSMFGGMPAYQISVNYSGNMVGYLDNLLTLGLPHPAGIVFLYFLGFFILLLALGADPWLSIAGAIAFAFSSYFFIIFEAGHNSKAHTIAYMAPVMAGIILTMNRKYLWGGLLTAIFLSLQIKANHPQITYYFAFIALLYGFFRLIQAFREKQLPSFFTSVGVLSIAALFAVLTNLTSLWATYEYGKYTIRGKSELTTEKENRTSGLDKDYATQWSYGIGESMTLLVPDCYGGSSSRELSPNSKVAEAMRANGVPDETIRQYTSQPSGFLYWGPEPFTSGPVYIGAIVVFLFVLGLLIVKGPMKWWLLTGTVLSLVLAWGRYLMPVTDFFMQYVPMYNKFRAVSMTLVIAEFTMPLLGFLALKELAGSTRARRDLFRSLWISAAVTAGVALLMALLPEMFFTFSSSKDITYEQQYQLPSWFMQAIREERIRLLRLDAIRSAIFILLGAGVIGALVFKKLKPVYAFLLLGVLILADMFPVNKRYINNSSFSSPSRMETPYEATSADEQILNDKQDPDFRVLNLAVDPFLDASTSWFHKSIGGYHGAKLRRYQEIIEGHIYPEIRSFARRGNTDSTPVLNMLNTRYIIVPAGKENQVMAFPNQKVLGNAWFVGAVRNAGNADEEIAALKNIRPDSVAVVAKEFESQISGFRGGKDSSDRIVLDSYSPNDLQYHYRSANGGL